MREGASDRHSGMEEAQGLRDRVFFQRINAVRFYLNAIGNMNYVPYLRSQSSLSEEQKSLIGFSDSDLEVQINLLNSDTLIPFFLLIQILPALK